MQDRYRSMLIKVLILLIIASPIFYKELILKLYRMKMVRASGIVIIARKDNSQHSELGISTYRWYSFFRDNKRFEGSILLNSFPYFSNSPNFGYNPPDSIQVIYLPNDPSINYPAHELFSDYKYSREDEVNHKPRPVFDEKNRKFIYPK